MGQNGIKDIEGVNGMLTKVVQYTLNLPTDPRKTQEVIIKYCTSDEYREITIGNKVYKIFPEYFTEEILDTLYFDNFFKYDQESIESELVTNESFEKLLLKCYGYRCEFTYTELKKFMYMLDFFQIENLELEPPTKI